MKDPSLMNAGEINRELDALDKKSSALTQKFIDAGRGYEKASETWELTDPLAMKYKEISSRMDALFREITARMGPGHWHRLPKGRMFGPIKRLY